MRCRSHHHCSSRSGRSQPKADLRLVSSFQDSAQSKEAVIMNRRIQEIFTTAEGRYLTQEEQDYISRSAASVEARLRAMQKIGRAHV